MLVAAFAAASLLTMAAVARRVREFGTLKALGWPSWRIIGQVMGESITIGISAARRGRPRYGGAALIDALRPGCPRLSGRPAPRPRRSRGLGRSAAAPLKALSTPATRSR